MACLLENTVVDLVEGRVAGARSLQITAHLDGCSACRVLVAEAVSASARPEAPPRLLLERGATLGRYVILELVGAGAMGVVYAAWDPALSRKVALKLLRGDSSNQDGRLLQEAQSLARLQHPHVIAVHDVGTAEGQVFLAMEFVEGQTLGAWLRERRRRPSELLPLFCAAGEGLAAAHAKGIVHRDFKPDNVLVGEDGRVRVTDFGLARAFGFAAEPDARPRSSSPVVTQTGALVGTPAYMSPEQMAGKPADARSDQFSFCVALFESLHGERPFQAHDVASLRAAIEQGQVRRPRRALTDRGVPSRIDKALLKGLQGDPSGRHDSMEALLAELRRPPAITLWRASAAAAVVALLFVGWRSAHPAVCGGAEQAWGDLWSAQRQEAARSAFAAAGSGAPQFARVDAALQRLHSAWTAMRTDACLATRARGEQSEALLDLRVLCLDDRRREAEALTQVFEQATPAVVAHADQALDQLTPLSRCAEARALSGLLPEPGDPALRARIEDAKRQAARAKALLDTNGSAAALPAAEGAVRAARDASFPPVEAQALYLRADALRRLQRFAEARADLQASTAAAIAARDDGTAADAFILLSFLEGFDGSNEAAGELWSSYAQASIVRLGGDDLREAQREFDLAHIYMNDMERLEQSRDHRRKALELFRKGGASEESRAWVQGYLAIGEGQIGHLDEGIRLLRNAVETQSRYGRDERNGVLLANLAWMQLEAERPADALEAARRGAELLRRNGIPSPFALHKVAWALRDGGKPAEALPIDRLALAEAEKAGASQFWLIEPLTGVGEDLVELDRPREAVPPLERAERLFADGQVAAGHEEVGRAQLALARALWGVGERKRARAAAQQARETFRNPAARYGSFYARLLAESEGWLSTH